MVVSAKLAKFYCCEKYPLYCHLKQCIVLRAASTSSFYQLPPSRGSMATKFS